MPRSLPLLVSPILLAALAGCQDARDPWIGGFEETAGPVRSSASSGREEGGSAFGGSGESAARLPDDPTLDDYLAYAALHNPGLEAAFEQWQAELQRPGQVGALPDPRLTYRYFIEEVETRVGAQRQSVGLSQTFPWPGKLRLRSEAAGEAARAAEARYRGEKLALFFRVRDAYAEYYYLVAATETVRELTRLLRNVEEVVRARYRAAEAEHPALIRAQVELGELEDRLAALRDLEGPAVARLNAALNRPPDAPLPRPEALEVPEVQVADARLQAWLAESNPRLEALSRELVRARREVELARKDYYPDVTVGVDWIQTAPSTGGRRPSDDGKDAVVAMVSMNLPIWWDKLRAGERQARYTERSVRLRRLQTRRDLQARVKRVAYEYRDAGRKIGLYSRTLVPKAREALRATMTGFRGGRSSFTDLLDAERILLEFELSDRRARADRLQALAELEMLVGRELTDRAPEPPGSPGNETPSADVSSVKPPKAGDD